MVPQVKKQNIGTRRTASDVDIPYLEYEGDGPALVFIHATGLFAWLWHPVARQFAGKHRVIVPCFSNYRKADPYNGGLPWSLLAKDTTNLCSALNIDSPALVGLSMGATVATLATALHGLNTRKMVMMEPIFLPKVSYTIKQTVEQHPMSSRAIKRRNQWSSIDEAAKYFKSKPLYQNWDSETFDLYLEHGLIKDENGFKLMCSPEIEAAQFLGGVQCDPWPHLDKVKCPVLVVEGGNSENRHFIDHKKIASLFPDGHFTQIEGAGHLIPMEKPVEIVECIEQFMV